jgi:hypothetical protein
MCDYSLMGLPNRLAREDEDLVVYRFPTGSRGLTPSEDCLKTTDTAQMRPDSFRSIVKGLFGALKTSKVAVCVPPGARLLLGDIPEDVQDSFNVGSSEEVTFTELTATSNTYRDAVRFENGRELLLQRLNDGQRVKVLRLSLAGEPRRSVGNASESFSIARSRS